MIVVDDVISTGGTLQATLDSLRWRSRGDGYSDRSRKGDGAEKLRAKGYDLKTMVRVRWKEPGL